jgi:hypothetical protein
MLNNTGKMIHSVFIKLSNKFINIEIDEYVIMPNHFHGIIQIVGADPRICPNNVTNKNQPIQGEHKDSPLPVSNIFLPKLIQWFKTKTTNEYIIGVKYHN